MDFLAPVRKLDRAQQHHRRLAIPLAVVKKFSDDQAGNLSALIAYYGFFSLFPLLLAFTTILGFVLAGDPATQHSVTDTITRNFPGIGKQLNIGHIHGSATALIVGVAGAVYAGLAVTNAAEQAFDRIWAVPFKDRSDFLRKRLKGLITLTVLGVLQIAATVVSGVVGGGLGGPLLFIAGVFVALLLNLALFMAAFRLLTNQEVPTSALWPGAVMAAVLWEALQLVGGVYVKHVLAKASGTYGSFALVIALLTWLFLGARVLIYSAELNVVLHRGLWPRSLVDSPQTAGDEETLAALAKVEERHESERIQVTFDGDESHGHRELAQSGEAAGAERGAAGGKGEGAGAESGAASAEEGAGRDGNDSGGNGNGNGQPRPRVDGPIVWRRDGR